MIQNQHSTQHAITGRNKTFFPRLKNILGFRPRNRTLYELAFIHKSASLKLSDDTIINNERLEFLGDAILDAVISDYLFTNFMHEDEGSLTKMRAKIVNRDNLNALAEKVGINQLLVSRVDQNKSGKNLPGNALEALIGAIYLDRGYRRTRKYVIHRVIRDHLNLRAILNTEIDFKSQIIEWAQKNRKEISFTSSDVFDNEKKTLLFTTRLLVDNHLLGSGKGLSKKEAEQNAAEEGLQKINGLPENDEKLT